MVLAMRASLVLGLIVGLLIVRAGQCASATGKS